MKTGANSDMFTLWKIVFETILKKNETSSKTFCFRIFNYTTLQSIEIENMEIVFKLGKKRIHPRSYCGIIILRGSSIFVEFVGTSYPRINILKVVFHLITMRIHDIMSPQTCKI